MKARLVDPLLRRCGIHPQHFWVLCRLFGELSDRHEMFGQLGRDRATLKAASLIYFLMMGLFGFLFAMSKPPVMAYFGMFTVLTGFLMLMVLLSETSNSLVNAVEGLVLAHQPINGATYTAAKLTHLARIVLWLGTGLNAIPAFFGLLTRGAAWFYPLLHLLTTYVLGFVIALGCCAVFGWLLRFVHPSRLRAVAQVAEVVPVLLFALNPVLRKPLAAVNWSALLPESEPARVIATGVASLLALGSLSFGIRSLSGDYLVRLSTIMRGGSGRKKERRRNSFLAGMTARWTRGGPPARAAYDYLARMMWRDSHFRRQMIPVIPMVFGMALPALQNWHISPFDSGFSPYHLIPHVFGTILFFLSTYLHYGGDFKAVWVFSIVPAVVFERFALGILGMVWTTWVLIPHLALTAILVFIWPLHNALLFCAYSLSFATAYLALMLRRVEGVPFSTQPVTSSNAFLMPLMLLGGLTMAAIVWLQHLVIFRSPPLVLGATVALAGAAVYLMPRTGRALAESMRFQLSTLAAESGKIYQEIEA